MIGNIAVFVNPIIFKLYLKRTGFIRDRFDVRGISDFVILHIHSVMIFFIFSIFVLYGLLSSPVTRYSTDTPRAWAILYADTTSGNRSFVSQLWRVLKLIPISSARTCCVIFFDFISGLTLFQKVFASIYTLSISKYYKKKYEWIKNILTYNPKGRILNYKKVQMDF